MKTIQDANAEIVLHHINRLNTRRTTYMRIGAILGLIGGLIIGFVLVFVLGMNQRWIGLGPLGMVLGILGGGFAGRIRRSDLDPIASELQPVSGDSDTNNTAANKSIQATPQ